MQTSEFSYELPGELIAFKAAEPRDSARMLVVDRSRGTLSHRHVRDLPEYLKPGDALARNNSRVVPAHLNGRRRATGGGWSGLFLRAIDSEHWEILAKTRGRPKIGEWLDVHGGLGLCLTARTMSGSLIVRPDQQEDAFQLLDRFGLTPLPPYIGMGRLSAEDAARYQTVFAKIPGSVAAPTAGLHFTEPLFATIAGQGVSIVDLTLHVGVGTFRPIESERIEEHALHCERAELDVYAARQLNATRAGGGRVVAVGTTSARTLETAVRDDGVFEAFLGETSIYLTPGHAFRGVDALVTNFHLPRSTLLVLVSAFAGIELIRSAYQAAIQERYRFFSYGDAMLIL